MFKISMDYMALAVLWNTKHNSGNYSKNSR